jgi:tellurite methyltransferase
MGHHRTVSQDDRARWNARHAARIGEPQEPAAFVREAINRLEAIGLPRGRRALDVACGRGGNALALARAGFDVTAVDVSDVALDELAAIASREGLDVETDRRDLAGDGLPAGVFDLVLVVHYLERALFPALRAAIAPGGALVFETYTTREHDRSGFSRAFCLEPGELAREAGDLRILLSREGPDEAGREVASLLGVRD